MFEWHQSTCISMDSSPHATRSGQSRCIQTMVWARSSKPADEWSGRSESPVGRVGRAARGPYGHGKGELSLELFTPDLGLSLIFTIKTSKFEPQHGIRPADHHLLVPVWASCLRWAILFVFLQVWITKIVAWAAESVLGSVRFSPKGRGSAMADSKTDSNG